jgi:hypothetical protein
MGAQRRPWRPFAIFLAVLALAGCGDGRYPPLSPMAQAGGYGYADKPLGGERYTVTYVGPSRLSSSAPAVRDRDAAAARTEALDLAIWRAAQLAQGAGFEGFRVIGQSSTVDVAAQPTYYDQQFYGPFGSNVGRGGIIRPPSVGTTAPMSYPESPTDRLQGRASVDIELLRNPGPNDLIAKDVIDQLRTKYPDAEKG